MLWIGLLIGTALGWTAGSLLRQRLADFEAEQRHMINPQTPYLHVRTGRLFRWRDRAWAHDSSAEFAVMTRLRDNTPIIYPEAMIRSDFRELTDADLSNHREPPPS